MTIKEDLGRRIKAERNRKQLTQSLCAEMKQN